jgi:hypothetical protein
MLAATVWGFDAEKMAVESCKQVDGFNVFPEVASMPSLASESTGAKLMDSSQMLQRA